MSIRDVDGNHAVLINKIGEICVRAYCNMIEYHGNPDATHETIDAEGWLHTGDFGTMDERVLQRTYTRLRILA